MRNEWVVMSRRDAELYHFGIKGMHWGERRFQNDDGSLTSAGRLRYLGDRVGNAAREAMRRIRSNATMRRESKNGFRLTLGEDRGLGAHAKALGSRARGLGDRVGNAAREAMRRVRSNATMRRESRNGGFRLTLGEDRGLGAHAKVLLSTASDRFSRASERGRQIANSLGIRMQMTMSQIGPNIRSAASNIARSGKHIIDGMMARATDWGAAERNYQRARTERHMREGYKPHLILDPSREFN